MQIAAINRARGQRNGWRARVIHNKRAKDFSCAEACARELAWPKSVHLIYRLRLQDLREQVAFQ